MVALSSSLPRHPHLLHISSFGINVKRPQHMITAESFQPTKKLIKQTAQTFETLNKNPLVIQKRNKQSLLPIIFNTLDDFICSFIDLPLRPSIDPKHVLSGHSAPVDEHPPTACEVVEGSLPSSLNGAYIRNGPNPQFIPKGPHHFFEGDGMLHMIKISQGKATFCSRYVKTHKLTVEREIGYPFVPGVFSSFNGLPASMARLVLSAGRVLTGQFDPATHGSGAANARLALFGGHLFALCESDLPYAVKVTPDGDIITLGRHDLQTSEPFLRMTAHPKIDQETGEAFAYGYDVKRPFLTFFRIDSQGRKQKGVPIFSMEGCTAIHDFAVTKNYAVFPDTQVVVNPRWILGGRSPVGIDLTKVPRLGIIPRYAEDESEMKWIDVPGFNMMHCVNAWEEDDGDTIVIVASNGLAVDQFLDNFHLAQLTIEKITINVKAKTVQRQPLSAKTLDLGVVNPAYAAKENSKDQTTIIFYNCSCQAVFFLDLLTNNNFTFHECHISIFKYCNTIFQSTQM
ncbi:hypothetical protein Pfo_010562, partial [Paulownia fortunei]